MDHRASAYMRGSLNLLKHLQDEAVRPLVDAGKESNMDENRSVSKWLVTLSVFYVVSGIVMLIWPHLTIDLLGKAIGIGMLVVGIAHIIIYITKDHMKSIMQMDLTVGVVIAAFGAFMLMHGDFVSMALPFAVGILLLIGGISHVQYALDMKRLGMHRWKIMLAFAIILLILGMILIYNPFTGNMLIYYIAASLMLNGVLTIISVLLIAHRAKRIARGQAAVGEIVVAETKKENI